MQSFCLIITIFLSLITLAPLLPSNHWVCRVWEFPRVQISVLLLVSVVLSLFFLDGVLLYICGLSNLTLLIYQLFWIIPFTALAPKQVKTVGATSDLPKLKVITSNVLMTNHSSHKLINLVQYYQPHVLVTLESDEWWQEALSTLHDDYPYRVARPLNNLYGIHLYSQYELSEVEVLDLIEEGIPSIHCYLHLPNDTKVKCHFVHPAPPSPTENETATPRDRELLLVAKKVKPELEPTVVTGDLNDVAWSPTTRAFRKESKLLDPRLGRGFFNTFHAGHIIARWPLDHIFHSRHLKLIELKRLPSIDSDHFPLYSSFIVEK